MNTFAQALETMPTMSLTANGGDTYASSMNANTDLFFLVGASRGNDITPAFAAAYAENPDLAMRILAWVRDIRGGAGERQTFRNLLSYLEDNHTNEVYKMLPLVPFYGRWDDLLHFKTEEVRNAAFGLISHALLDMKDGLCAKWMPRKATKDDNTAYLLRQFMGLSPKQYRQVIVSLTNVVEQKMCAKEWQDIDFSKLPSLASARYNKAFMRNAQEQYAIYKEKLVNGETTINAQAVYPHDVLKTIKSGGDSDVATAQWNALPNFLSEATILPMADVSSSMNCSVGDNPKLTCMDISIALGLYIADKQEGPFHNMVLTFDTNPKIEVLKGTLVEKYNQISHMSWGGSTNIEKAFDRILEVALRGKVPQEQMPKYLLIFSDMEFNSTSNGTAFNTFEKKFKAEGYDLPKLVFWNLNARMGNIPVTYNEQGVALVSGFSPSLLKSILSCKTFTPQDIMLETIMTERYDFTKINHLFNKPVTNQKMKL